MYVPTEADRVHGSAQLRRRQALGRTLAHGLGRLDIAGLEHVPASGPVIVAMNHRSAFDGPLLFGFFSRPVNFLVKSEAFTPGLGPVLLSAAQIPITRTSVDAGAVRLCLRVLGAGGVVGIFPEGSRGDGLVGAARPGVGYLALRTGACVVPVACHGTDAMTHRAAVRRPNVRMVLGPGIPVEQAPPDRPLNRRVVAAKTEEIRAVLADLVASTAFPAPRRKAAA